MSVLHGRRKDRSIELIHRPSGNTTDGPGVHPYTTSGHRPEPTDRRAQGMDITLSKDARALIASRGGTVAIDFISPVG